MAPSSKPSVGETPSAQEEIPPVERPRPRVESLRSRFVASTCRPARAERPRYRCRSCGRMRSRRRSVTRSSAGVVVTVVDCSVGQGDLVMMVQSRYDGRGSIDRGESSFGLSPDER